MLLKIIMSFTAWFSSVVSPHYRFQVLRKRAITYRTGVECWWDKAPLHLGRRKHRETDVTDCLLVACVYLWQKTAYLVFTYCCLQVIYALGCVQVCSTDDLGNTWMHVHSKHCHNDSYCKRLTVCIITNRYHSLSDLFPWEINNPRLQQYRLLIYNYMTAIISTVSCFLQTLKTEW